MDPIITRIEETTKRALLSEVRTTPKPGLVDLKDNGAHTDMCYKTFELSTEAITPHIARMALMGLNWTGAYKDLFQAIRPAGMEAERSMFLATGGVNTHKGIIFSLGIIAAACGFYYRQHGCFNADAILLSCRDMTYQALEHDFSKINPANPQTHGERLYVRYGFRGIRGEAQNGFSSVRLISLPCIRSLTRSPDFDPNQVYLQVLLTLMAQVDDTNILTRSDPETLSYVKREADRILGLGGSYTEAGMDAIIRLNEDFIKRNVSPGGCADLLAITIFLRLLEQ